MAPCLGFWKCVAEPNTRKPTIILDIVAFSVEECEPFFERFSLPSDGEVLGAGEEAPLASSVSMKLFILFNLLFEFGLDDIDRRKHIDRTFADFDGFARQVQDGVAGADFFAVFLALFEADFEMCALANVLRKVFIDASELTGNVLVEVAADFGVDAANFKFL